MKDNWPVKKLGEVAEFINGFSFKSSEWDTQGLPIIRIQNLNNISAQYNYYSKSIDQKYVIENGDLLISWSASLDSYIWDRGKALLNQHIFKVNPKEKIIDIKFLYYLIKNIIGDLLDQIHGSTMKHITKEKFENIEIIVPPIEEQKRIVKKLEKILSKIQETKKLQQEQLQELEALKQSVLHQAFQGKL